VLCCLAFVAVGCGAGATATGRLSDRHPCPGSPGFTCATLTVPLDHAGQARGTLRLAVAIQNVAAAPRGVLVFLTGGPGQPGVPLVQRVSARLHAALAGYRLVMFDQRGTGDGALECPGLQRAAGSSDLVVVPDGVVAECARRIGAQRRFFTTPETLADLDELRTALDARRLTLDGVSYGTFVAERYALAYPSRVARLVLDSVVPQTGADPLYLASLQQTARALRAACAAQRCGTDPASDLAAVVRRDRNGPALQNAIVADSIAFPSFAGVAQALHAARRSHPGRLDAFLRAVQRGEAAPAPALSQGLHESTLCLDLGPPWDPSASPAAREVAVARAAARLPASAFFPFDRATAAGSGLVRDCLAWPPTTAPDVAPANPMRPLPPVPVLLLAGGRDLSTPLAWARTEARNAPDGRLVVVPNAGHSVQLRAANAGALLVLARFLAGRT
jgi:pimeloyl-ACP methyl ester carboxylesterase